MVYQKEPQKWGSFLFKGGQEMDYIGKRVRIIEEEDSAFALELEVNTFLENRKVFDIQYSIAVIPNGEGFGRKIYSAMIVYED